MLIKIGVETIPPMTVAAGRLLLAAVLLTLFAVLGGHGLPRNLKVWGVCLFIGVFGNALPFTLIGWGELQVDSGLAAILMGVVPIATAMLAHMLSPDEPLSAGPLIGILIGFTGLVMLVGWQSLGGLQAQTLYQFAVLTGALSYAVTNVFARRYVQLPGRVLAAGATTAA